MLIKESHLDSFGHVNNATYVMLYEEARWDFITQKGLGLDYIQLHQVGPVILNLSVSFKKELRNRQRIIIQSEFVKMMNSKIFHLKQAMISLDRQITFSEAFFDIGFFHLKERKLISLPEEWKAMIPT